MKTAGFQIRVHDDHFKDDEVDPVWLKVCGENGWVVLTSDKRIERQWFREIESGPVRIFIVYTYPNDPVEAWFARIMKALPRILRIIKKNPAPFVAHITHDGISALNTIFGAKRKQPMRENSRVRESAAKSNGKAE